MKYIFNYNNDEERQGIILSNSDKFLIEEQNITEGNFLIFTDVKPIEQELMELQQKIKLLEAQNNANSERADFTEEVIAEMAMMIYQ